MTNGRSRPTADEEPAAGALPDTDYGIAFSPRQVAGGFAIIAALLVLLVRRRHSGKKR
jgi:hypothetical protein